ncbi:hypothetical protein Patl1_10412 [Pistacia atlantica]|uniref:Uncharacterized protein n=1 Tax=Pistacia atlantica TaxID=434234 RepID=A0ACC1A1A9_9ROSI|nr:hypothetical protein Patl1_10412 [Pistacia atlantica]
MISQFQGAFFQSVCWKLACSTCKDEGLENIVKFIGEWADLERLEMYSSGLKGPIPSAIFDLGNLKDLCVEISGLFAYWYFK